MNTIEITNIVKIRRVNIMTRAIIAAACLISAQHANALNDENNNESSRSLTVKYEENQTKPLAKRDDLEINTAQQAAIAALPQLKQTIEPRKTRVQVITERKDKLHSSNRASDSRSTQSLQSSHYVEFGIYGASSRLFEDFDYDGFYQTFSVTFDADIYSQYAGERAVVFADLYVSRNNGPWELYFTTDTFTIVDDNSADEYEVLTTLDLGYKTAHYDVLIDLYEVGYSDPVATISSADVDSLYALPLESADRDEYVVVETYGPEVIISGGSMSLYSLLVVICAIGLRIKRQYKKL